MARSARPEVFERGILLSGSAGRSAEVLAEHAVYFMLNACYHTRELMAAQSAHEWLREPGMYAWRGLYGRTAGIIGMGHTGKCLAERLHAFGMRLYTYSRSATPQLPFIDHEYVMSRGEGPEALYENSDFIILCIAMTDQTRHMLDAAAFAHVKRGAVLVNMGRGQLVDNEALLAALSDGTLSCAGLDVFDPEPLPKDSPLWDCPNVYITPHITPAVPDRNGRCLEIIRENVRRYLHEEPLINQVKPEDRYSGT